MWHPKAQGASDKNGKFNQTHRRQEGKLPRVLPDEGKDKPRLGIRDGRQLRRLRRLLRKTFQASFCKERRFRKTKDRAGSISKEINGIAVITSNFVTEGPIVQRRLFVK